MPNLGDKCFMDSKPCPCIHSFILTLFVLMHFCLYVYAITCVGALYECMCFSVMCECLWFYLIHLVVFHDIHSCTHSCLSFISHTSCSSYASLSLFLTLFLSLFLIGHFVIYDKKGENYLLLCTFIRRRNSIGKNAFIKGHLSFPWSNIEIFFKLDFYQSKERTASSYLFVWWDSRKKFRP